MVGSSWKTGQASNSAAASCRWGEGLGFGAEVTKLNDTAMPADELRDLIHCRSL